MTANVGMIDRIIRIIAGLGLLVWAAFLNGPPWAWVGVLPFATGLLRVCPAYSVLGINTCGRKK